MKTLRNIKKIPMEIAQLLSLNPTLCGLIVDDKDNPDNQDISFDELLKNHYINLYPVVESGDIKDNTRSSYIIILLDSINTTRDNNNISVSGDIYVTTDFNHILLQNYKNRLLEMADEVFKTLNEVKLTSSGKLIINNITYVVMNNFRTSYRLSFTISDQQIERTEI